MQAHDYEVAIAAYERGLKLDDKDEDSLCGLRQARLADKNQKLGQLKEMAKSLLRRCAVVFATIAIC